MSLKFIIELPDPPELFRRIAEQQLRNQSQKLEDQTVAFLRMGYTANELMVLHNGPSFSNIDVVPRSVNQCQT